MICSLCTHTMPFPHLSQTGSFCRFPEGAAGLVMGAFTVRVTMGRVPGCMTQNPLNKTSSRDPITWIKTETLKAHTAGLTTTPSQGNVQESAFVLTKYPSLRAKHLINNRSTLECVLVTDCSAVLGWMWFRRLLFWVAKPRATASKTC